MVVNAVEPEFDLFETLRLENGEFSLSQRHINRISESANYFGFTLARDALDDALARRKAGVVDEPEARAFAFSLLMCSSSTAMK